MAQRYDDVLECDAKQQRKRQCEFVLAAAVMDDVSTIHLLLFVCDSLKRFRFVSICAQFAPKFIDSMDVKLSNKL